MASTKYFPVEATHETFTAVETEVGLPGTRTFYPPETVGTLLVARRVSLNYDCCDLQVGSVQILGMIVGSSRPVPHQGKPCYQVLTMEHASDRWREKARLKVAEQFRVMPEDVSFYTNGQVVERKVIFIDN